MEDTMNKQQPDKTKTPNEIPTEKTPHNSNPLKDPSTPNKNNPINPQRDEPNGYKKQK